MFRSEHSSTIIATRLAGLVVVVSTALSVLLSACSDLPTDARATPTETPHAALASDAISANAIAGVSDALDRIVPTLTRPAAEPLRAALESLRGRLADNGRDAAAIHGAVKAAKDAVCAYSQAVGPEPGSAADLDALRLTLGALTACTGSPSSEAESHRAPNVVLRRNHEEVRRAWRVVRKPVDTFLADRNVLYRAEW